MAEYIDKSDAETVFREVRKRLSAKKKDYVAIEFLIKDQMLSAAEEVVHAIPAADVVERKHGNWINPRPDSEMCSACGVRFSISSLFAVGGNEEPNFCPNCGSDMRGEDDV